VVTGDVALLPRSQLDSACVEIFEGF